MAFCPGCCLGGKGYGSTTFTYSLFDASFGGMND